MKIDVIIPTYRPQKEFLKLVQCLSEQSLEINKIIIVNTEQKFFDRIAYASKFTSDYRNAEVHHISRVEFDNGKTRNQAVSYSDADYFIMMSQDMVPNSDELVSELIKAITQSGDIAMAYGRQIPGETVSEAEKYVMGYFFPDDSYIRSANDLTTYGWLTYFASNGCAIYRRDIFDELGGFTNHAIMNEDIMYASKAIHQGYRVAYASKATVISYKHREKDELKRFHFDFGVSIAKHPEIFNVDEIKNSVNKLSKLTTAHLKRNGRRDELIKFFFASRAQKKGFNLGRKYARLSKEKILKLTNNKSYWKTDELLSDRSGVNARLGYGRSAEEVKMLNTPPVNAKKRSEMDLDNN